MEPKTIMQKQVCKLSKRLAPISEKQMKWAYEHCFDHSAHLMKGGNVCMDCGHRWINDRRPALNDSDQVHCPDCGRRLTIKKTRKQKVTQSAYFCIITTCQEFQVMRFFDVYGYYRAGQKPNFAQQEVVQRWMTTDCRHEVIARTRPAFSNYRDTWSWGSRLEVRGRRDYNFYNITPHAIYPIRRYLPDISRNGFKGHFHGLSPFDTFRAVLSNTNSETLLKARQHALFAYSVHHPLAIKTNWASIKICIRNNYTIKDGSMWIDYIGMLKFFDKDLRSPKYVCPKNLKKEHDLWEKRKRRQLERDHLERLRKQAIEDEKNYKKNMEKFFDLVFSDGEIEIKTFASVHDVMEEGDALHHCVFTSGYHRRKDTLLLTARKKGERLETVEISLNTMRVVQCRGLQNKNSEYHDKILGIVNKNLPKIRKRITA
ncbi:PcfJ domain-containing protein [uncultured Alistipes sp.]|jgi:hypothetical protein|uniref:PcfJ domain-containing protein n=1 Tax=uncultured Alistipes sp. TaxID=538949 RepID=UPI0025E67FD1|nr:PcfJ domain-containing protein [uncultured Alistipes sp.]